MEKSRLMELAGIVTESKTESVECPFCDKKIKTGKLLTHIKKTHSGDYSDMFESVITEKEDKEEKKMMTCPLCDEEHEHGTLLKHIKADHKDARKLVQDKMKEEEEKDGDKEDDKDE